MEAVTPEQMRALADGMFGAAYNDPNAVRVSLMTEAATALRTAADQLEAVQAGVQALVDEYLGDGTETETFTERLKMLAILTTDTAPQEDMMSDRESPGRTRRIDRRYMVQSVRRGANWNFGAYTYHRARWNAEVSFWLFSVVAGRPTRLIDRGTR